MGDEMEHELIFDSRRILLGLRSRQATRLQRFKGRKQSI